MSSTPSHLYILLPAYNEERALRQLLPDLARTLKPIGIPFTIGVIDDGSSDGTPALMQTLSRDLPLKHLRHEHNQGYGATIKTGVLWAIQIGQPDDIAIMLDSDNTHSPSYIPALLDKLQKGYDAVTASYTLPGGAARGVPVVRQIMSRGANALLGARFRFRGIGTYTNGYRAYRVRALQQAHRHYGDRIMKETNFAGGTELFIKTVRSGARPGEIPFVLDYEKRGGDSKINIPKTILGYLKLLTLF